MIYCSSLPWNSTDVILNLIKKKITMYIETKTIIFRRVILQFPMNHSSGNIFLDHFYYESTREINGALFELSSESSFHLKFLWVEEENKWYFPNSFDSIRIISIHLIRWLNINSAGLRLLKSLALSLFTIQIFLTLFATNSIIEDSLQLSMIIASIYLCFSAFKSKEYIYFSVRFQSFPKRNKLSQTIFSIHYYFESS